MHLDKCVYCEEAFKDTTYDDQLNHLRVCKVKNPTIRSQEISSVISLCDKHLSEVTYVEKQLSKSRAEITWMKECDWEGEFKKLKSETTDGMSDRISQLEEVNTDIRNRELEIKALDSEVNDILLKRQLAIKILDLEVNDVLLKRDLSIKALDLKITQSLEGVSEMV